MHSLHAYFLRRGDFNAPIVYDVDRARDGNHFSTRRVVAIQHGEQIFNMSASFQSAEQGLEHRRHAGGAGADELPDVRCFRDLLPVVPERLRRWLEQQEPFEFRPVQPAISCRAGRAGRTWQVWFRAVAGCRRRALHRCLLAYASDFNLMDTAMRPHGVSMAGPRRSRSRASTTRCGSTTRAYEISGCCTRPTARAPRARAASRAAGIYDARRSPGGEHRAGRPGPY